MPSYVRVPVESRVSFWTGLPLKEQNEYHEFHPLMPRKRDFLKVLFGKFRPKMIHDIYKRDK